ncbi:oligosaccharide flippase family protein [Ekhidna sp.]
MVYKKLKAIKNKFNKSYLLKGSALSFVAKVIAFVIGFAFQIIIARSLSIEEYGNYSYLMNLVFFSNTIAVFGLNTTAKKIIPRLKVENDYAKIRGFFVFSSVVIIILSVLVGFIDYFFLSFQEWEHGIENVLFVITVLVLLTAIVDFLSNSLFAFKKPFLGAITLNALRYLTTIILIGYLFFQSELLDVAGLLQFTIYGFIVAAAIQMYFVSKQIGWKESSTNFEIKSWVSLASGLLLVNSFFVIQNRIDIQLLGVFRSKEEIGLYNAVFRGSEMSRFVFKAVSSVSMPMISALFAQSASNEVIQKKLRNITKLLFWPSFAVIILIGIFSKFFLLLFGTEFVQANIPFIILLFGQLMLASNGTGIMVLNMSGYHKLSLRIFIFASLTNVLLNLILIPYYGILGAAISTCLVNVLIGFGSSFLVRKKLDLNTRII